MCLLLRGAFSLFLPLSLFTYPTFLPFFFHCVCVSHLAPLVTCINQCAFLHRVVVVVGVCDRTVSIISYSLQCFYVYYIIRIDFSVLFLKVILFWLLLCWIINITD